MIVKNQKFANDVLQLDFTHYDQCEIHNCLLLYSGYSPFRLSNCSIDNPRFDFDGPALNTIRFLAGLYRSGAKDQVEEIFAAIRAGQEPPTVQ